MEREIIGYIFGKPVYTDEVLKYSLGWFKRQYRDLTEEAVESTNTRFMFEISQLKDNHELIDCDRSLLTQGIR